MWRERQWRKLANLIDHLPRNSHYGEAVATDTELAEQLLDTEQVPNSVDGRPRMADWSLEAERLTDACNLLMQVSALLLGLGGGKPRQPRPLKPPRTAVEQAKADAQAEGVEVLNRLLIRTNETDD